MIMKNDYEVRGDITVIFLKKKNGEAFETIISTEDLPKAMEMPNKWAAKYDPDIKNYYVRGRFPKVNGKVREIRLHRWLMGDPKGMVIDHMNHDTLNNTRDNLRVITNAQNQQNRKGAMKNNKSSGIRGVTWHKRDKKWQAEIIINRKYKFLGYFDDVKEAEKAAIEARTIYMPFSTN